MVRDLGRFGNLKRFRASISSTCVSRFSAGLNDSRTALEDLRTTFSFGAQYALSDTGSLLYAAGGATDQGRLVKVDRIDSWMPKPELMFAGNYLSAVSRPWDVMSGGQHFLMIQPTHPDPPGSELHLVQNWFEELKRPVPVK